MESKIVLTLLAMVTEMERDVCSERRKEGLRARKAVEVKLGKPKGADKRMLDKHKDKIVSLLQNGSTRAFVTKQFIIPMSNLINWQKRTTWIIRA